MSVVPQRWSRLMSDSFWSLVGNIAGIAGGVLQYKVISALVPADQYGGASLVLGVLALLNMFLINPLLTAQLRLYFDYAQQGMGALYQRRFRLVLSMAAGVCVLAYLLFSTASRARGNHVYWGLALPAILVLVFTPQASATTNILELKRQYRDLSIAALVGKLLLVGILATLLLSPMPKASAIVLASALAPALVTLLFRKRATVDGATHAGSGSGPIPWKQVVGAGFGGALYISNFFSWIVTTSDRYVIGHSLPLHEVGVYTMNYGLWSVPYLALNAWLETTLRARTYARAAADDWRGVRRVTWIRLGVGVAAAVAGTAAVYLVGPFIAHWFLGARYSASTKLMMTLALAHVFYVTANSFVPVFLAAKKAQYVVAGTAVAAVFNIGLNVWLVPKYGIYAAAVNTLLAYVIQTGANAVCAQAILARLVSRGGRAASPSINLEAAAQAGAGE